MKSARGLPQSLLHYGLRQQPLALCVERGVTLARDHAQPVRIDDLDLAAPITNDTFVLKLVRRTPRNAASASWVSEKLLPQRSCARSSQRASRASRLWATLQAAVCWDW